MEDQSYEQLPSQALADHQRFQAMRFQILTFSLTKAGEFVINDAYVYAWYEGIYPFACGAEWHRPFRDLFSVGPEQIRALDKILDDAWMGKKSVSFDSVERSLASELGRGRLSDSKLRMACTYIKMKRRYDEPFWTSFINGPGPGHVRLMLHKFDRRKDIEF